MGKMFISMYLISISMIFEMELFCEDDVMVINSLPDAVEII